MPAERGSRVISFVTNSATFGNGSSVVNRRTVLRCSRIIVLRKAKKRTTEA
jgi:hypothetical protein